MVSMDGGIANAIGREWLHGVEYDPEIVDAPILHLYEDFDPEIVRTDFTLLRSLRRADPIVIEVDELHHVHFTSLGMVSGLIPGLRVGPPSPLVVEKAAAVHAATLRFLDGWVMGEGPDAFRALIESSSFLHRVEIGEHADPNR